MDSLAVAGNGASSPFAVQLKGGFANLKFRGFLERDFRETLVEQNLGRGRLAALIMLGIGAAIIAVEWARFESPELDMGRALQLGLIMPALLMTMLATCIPALKQYYSRIAAASLMVLGLFVVYRAQAAAVSGDTYLTMGLILVILYVLYVCLFPGLPFRVSASIGSLLVVSYCVVGLAIGAPIEQLSSSTALLVPAVMISALASYNLEYVLRTTFLETRLLHELAERDGLTGLYNRRMFDDHIQRIWRQSKRERMSLEIVLIDIDHFKTFNDLYGHQAGDDCLKKVAHCIAMAARRPMDFVARYGGEEFALVLYGPKGDFARAAPEQVRLSVKELAIPHEGSSVDKVVTVSVGVALAHQGSGRSLAGTIQIADEALYQAKQAGRNQVVCEDANDYELQTGLFRIPKRKSA